MGRDQEGGIDAVTLPQRIPIPRLKAGPLVGLKVEMGKPGPVTGAHGSQLLSARQDRAWGHGDPVEMTVETVNQASVWQAVSHYNHLAPPVSLVSGKNDKPVTCRMDRIAEVGIASADAIQVVAQVLHSCPLIHLQKRLGIVGKCTPFGAEGLLKENDRRKKEAREGIVQHEGSVKDRDAPI